LVDERHTRLMLVAVVMLGDVDPTVDVVQDVFLGVHVAWSRLRDRQEAAGHLRRSVVNGPRSWLRQQAGAWRHRPPAAGG
jgi:DNA-directed RNA polymerase specialized sigma24 family protein